MKHSLYLLSGLLAASLALSACGNSNSPPPALKKLGVFRSANDCKDVEDYVKNYIEHAKDYTPPSYYEDAPIAMPMDGSSSGTSGGDTGTGGNQADSGGMAEQGSSTVVQSDIAFPDVARGLLYTFDQNKNLKTYRVEPVDQAQLLSTFSLNFEPRELVSLNVDSHAYLAVFGLRYPDGLDANKMMSPAIYTPPAYSVLAILDLTLVDQPQKLVQYELGGYFLDGRAFNADGKITWVNQASVSLDFFNSDQVFPELKRNDGQVISNEDIVSCVDTLLYESEDDYDYPLYDLSYTLISSLDLKTMKISTQGLLSPAWNTLVSVNPQHLYLAQKTFDSVNSELYQFSLEPLQLRASTLVEGEIPNQFFIGEAKDGTVSVFHYLNNWNFDFPNCIEFCAQPVNQAEETSLQIGTYLTNYVVEGDKLQVQGRVGPLAPNERPFAARFSDHFGYVITYQQIDPLFVVDLSDASQPKLLYEQKIDEVSYHLEEIPSDGDTHLLLGIGGLPQEGTVVANLFEIDSSGHANVADQLLLSDPGEHSWSVIFSEYRGLGISQDRKSFVVPVDSDMKSSLAYFSVDPLEKKLVGLQKISKAIVDYNHNYSRGYIFDQSLAGLSYAELELFGTDPLQKLQTWPLQ